MKNLKSLAVIFAVAFATLSLTAQTKNVDVKTSTINWLGKKVTGQHNGTVDLIDGTLIFKSKTLAGGNFSVNMNTLTATDLSGESKEKLNGHLKAEDFFGTAKFPTSLLVFKKITLKSNELYTVTADLTIKGITKPVTFDLIIKNNTASTTFKIDRTKYDIKYGSKSFFDSLGDKAISDEFELAVVLKF